MVGTNGQMITRLIGQSCVLVGKWARADSYFILWYYTGSFEDNNIKVPEVVARHISQNLAWHMKQPALLPYFSNIVIIVCCEVKQLLGNMHEHHMYTIFLD